MEGPGKYLPAAIPGKFSQVADPRFNMVESLSFSTGIAKLRATV